jgi:hypothetical protein
MLCHVLQRFESGLVPTVTRSEPTDCHWAEYVTSVSLIRWEVYILYSVN